MTGYKLVSKDDFEKDKIKEAIKIQKGVIEEQSVLYEKLHRSVQIEEIFPDAFELGPCKSNWVDVDIRNYEGELLERTVKVVVTRGDGATREIVIAHLPSDFVEDVIREKGITGNKYVDRAKCGRTVLTNRLSRIARENKVKAKKQ